MSESPPAASHEANPRTHASSHGRSSEAGDALDSVESADAETRRLSAEPPAQPAKERVFLDDQSIRRALMRMAHEIVESADGIEPLYLVAIPNGGVPLGRVLADNLESLTGRRPPVGILDTTLYRDDLATRGSRPKLRRTEMPSSVDDRVVVLVEDVVNTGRTIRAAMDALMDFGRPSHVRVVALVDRGHRELPIKIDYVGKNIPTQPGEKVVFRQEAAGARQEAAGAGAGAGDRPDGSADASEGSDSSEDQRVGRLELVIQTPTRERVAEGRR